MKKTPQQTLGRVASFVTAFAVVVAQMAIFATPASAAQITSRRLTLQAGTTDGGSAPGGTVNHFLEFTLPSSTAVGSVLFEYCDTAADTAVTTCTRPTGLDTSGGALGSENGATGFTFSSLDTTVSGAGGGGEVNAVLLTRTSAAASGAVSYRLDNIVNPSATNKTFFVRITTYASNDGTGPATDTGTVAASTSNAIDLSGTMPESLVFCTGKSVPLAAGVPDCANATAGAVAFDQLFTPSDTAVATSQMAASTNAGSGYAITVNGTTLQSGANSISSMGTTGVSNPGVSQFGLNLVANTDEVSSSFWDTASPASADISSASNGTNFKARAADDYATADSFKYLDGDTVAASDDDGASGQLGSAAASDAQIYTVSYIVNVPGSQPAGSYSTTLTYICTPTF